MLDRYHRSNHPIIINWDWLGALAAEPLSCGNLTVVTSMPAGVHPLCSRGFAFYFSPKPFEVKRDDQDILALPGGFIGVPAGTEGALRTTASAIRIEYADGGLSTGDDYHYNKRMWGLSLDTAEGILALIHDRRKKTSNGCKFIVRNPYDWEAPLAGNRFYVPANLERVPVLTSYDVFLAAANKFDAQDYHTHQNTIEFVFTSKPLRLKWHDDTCNQEQQLSNLTGLVIIPAMVSHKITISDVEPVFFLGIRETDAGNDKIMRSSIKLVAGEREVAASKE